MTLFHQPTDVGVLRPKIQDVVLVDPGWNNQQWGSADGCRRWLVLDQLNKIVLQNHLSGRQRKIAAKIKGLGINHAGFELSFIALKVIQDILKPLYEIFALGVDRPLQDIRIGQSEVRGRHRIDKLTGVKIDLRVLFVINSRD